MTGMGEAYIWLGDDSYGRAGIDHFYSPIDYSQNIDFFNNAINSEPEIRHPFNNSYLHNFMFWYSGPPPTPYQPSWEGLPSDDASGCRGHVSGSPLHRV